MAAETDKFVIATCALWAGDFAYFEELLQEFSPPHVTPPIDDGAKVPVDFIRATGALRLRQFWQKRGEFKKLAAELSRQGIDLTDKPAILETKHLRATVWRVGEREFQFQGYLTDLAWQEALFMNAHREAARTGPLKAPLAPPLPAQSDLFKQGTEDDMWKSPGIGWVIPADLFIQVELTDLGLIEGMGLWVKPSLPREAEEVAAPFQRLLNALDEPAVK